MSSEIAVQLRVKSDQVAFDMGKARAKIQAALANGRQAGATAASQGASSVTGAPATLPGVASPLYGQGAANSPAIQALRAAQAAASAASSRYSGPIPPRLPPRIPAPSPAPGGGGTGGGGIPPAFWNAAGAFGGRFGMSGLATAGRAGPIGLAVAAVAAELMFFKKMLSETLHAIADAQSLYGRTIGKGGSGTLRYEAGRDAMSRVMGVSREDVDRLGAAFAHMNSRLKHSVDIVAKTTPILAAVGQDFKVVGEELKAMFATIATGLAPMFRLIAQNMADGISRLTSFFAFWAKGLTTMSTIIINMMNKIRAIYNSIASKIGLPTVPMADIKPAARPGGTPERGGGMPFSTWEKMGLVLGGNVVTSAADMTARNTGKSAATLDKILDVLSRGGMSPRKGPLKWADDSFKGNGSDIHSPTHAMP